MQERIGSITEVSIISSWQDEADCRLVSHIAWSVKRGCERVVVVFNDTDYIVLILRCITTFISMELEEVLVEFGGEHRPKITRHSLHVSFGAAFCSILVKVHVLTSNDAVSKVGTKHFQNSFSLTSFAETDSLTTVDISVVERYLVKAPAGTRSNTTADTFDKFRHNSYLNEKALTDLPPTLSAICGHIRWCFCVIRNAITLLETHQHDLLPQNVGCTNEIYQYMCQQMMKICWWIDVTWWCNIYAIAIKRFITVVYSVIFFFNKIVSSLFSTLTRLWRAPEISVILEDHSDTSPGDLRVWLHEITMTS